MNGPIFLLLFLSILSKGNCLISLEQHNIDPTTVSVSGISSGGAMATQYHVVHSADIMGAGVFAGIPFLCAQENLFTALICMEEPWLVSVPLLVAETNSMSLVGTIDNVSNMQNDRVFVYHSLNDTAVNPGISPKIAEYYGNYMNSANIATKFDIIGEHTYPTDFYGPSCMEHGEYYISNCSYNGAFHTLNHMYGGGLVQPDPNNRPELTGTLDYFDQSEFFYVSPPSASSMDTVGHVYIPSGCVDKTEVCKLHIVFHGCMQGNEVVEDVFFRNTGYLEVGELNIIILLFPQAISTLLNPYGCWDWWGYTGILYPTHSGLQNTAVKRMQDRLVLGS